MNSSFINDDLYTSFVRRRTSSASSQQSPLDFTTSSIHSTDTCNEFTFTPKTKVKLYELFPKTEVTPPNFDHTLNETTYSASILENSFSYKNDINAVFLPKYSSMFNMPPPSLILTPSYYHNYSTDPMFLNDSNGNAMPIDYSEPYNYHRNRNMSSNSIDYSDFYNALSDLSLSDLDTSTSPNTNNSTMNFGARTLNYSNNTPSLQSPPKTITQPYYNNNTQSSLSTYDQDPKTTICTFCRKNNERPSVYLTHVVRGTVGNRKVVTCPILRRYICPECGVSGDYAHTLAYCPKTQKNKNHMTSITIALKNTRVQSKGIKKY